MAKPSSTAKLVITSIIISIIVLAVFVLIFINSIVPAYQVTADQIYSVLTKIFPILIGLLLIQVGVMAAKKGEPEYKDTIDKLSPNAYDSALYTAAKDDPAKAAAPAEKTIEVVKEVPVERIVEKEVPVEIIKEVPVEVVREVGKPEEILSFRDVVNRETEDAVAMSYDLSILAVREDGGYTAESVESVFEEDTMVFEEDSTLYAILPFYSRSDTEKAAESIEEKKIASLDGRDISGETLLNEASF